MVILPEPGEGRVAETPEGIRGRDCGKEVEDLIIHISADLLVRRKSLSQFNGSICLFIVGYKVLHIRECIAYPQTYMLFG